MTLDEAKTLRAGDRVRWKRDGNFGTVVPCAHGLTVKFDRADAPASGHLFDDGEWLETLEFGDLGNPQMLKPGDVVEFREEKSAWWRVDKVENGTVYFETPPRNSHDRQHSGLMDINSQWWRNVRLVKSHP